MCLSLTHLHLLVLWSPPIISKLLGATSCSHKALYTGYSLGSWGIIVYMLTPSDAQIRFHKWRQVRSLRSKRHRLERKEWSYFSLQRTWSSMEKILGNLHESSKNKEVSLTRLCNTEPVCKAYFWILWKFKTTFIVVSKIWILKE